jgi:hypothetical protein
LSFEIDQIGRITRSGWSVLIRGLAEVLTRGDEPSWSSGPGGAGVHPWAPGEHGRWMRIIPQGISGRRIVPGSLPPPFEPGSYF